MLNINTDGMFGLVSLIKNGDMFYMLHCGMKNHFRTFTWEGYFLIQQVK